MTIADTIRRVKEGIEEVKREAERIKRATPARTPAFPARQREPELAPTPEVRERRERRERERRPAPKPAANWWLDPTEQEAVMDQAAQIAERDGPTRRGRRPYGGVPSAPVSPEQYEWDVESRVGAKLYPTEEPSAGLLGGMGVPGPPGRIPATPRGMPPTGAERERRRRVYGPVRQVEDWAAGAVDWMGRTREALEQFQEREALREPYTLPVIGEVEGFLGQQLRGASYLARRGLAAPGRAVGAAVFTSREFDKAYAPYGEEAKRRTEEEGYYVSPLQVMSEEYMREGEAAGPYLDREDLITSWTVGFEDRGWTMVAQPEKTARFEEHLAAGSTPEEILDDPQLGPNFWVEFLMQTITDPLNLIPGAVMERLFPVGRALKAGGRAFGLVDNAAGAVMRKFPVLDLIAQRATRNWVARYSDDVLDGVRIVAATEVPGAPGMSFVEKLGRLMAGDEQVLATIPERLQPLMVDVANMTQKRGWGDVATMIGRGAEDVRASDVGRIVNGAEDNLARYFAEAAARAKGADLDISYRTAGAVQRTLGWGIRFLKESWLYNPAMCGLQTTDAYARASIYGHFASPFDLPGGHWLGRLVGHRPIGKELAEELASMGAPVPAELQDSFIKTMTERWPGRRGAYAQIPIPGIGKPEATIRVTENLFGESLVARHPWLVELMEPQIGLTASREVIDATPVSGGMVGRVLRNLNLASGLDQMGELTFMADRNIGLKIVADTVRRGAPASKEEFLSELVARGRKAGIADGVIEQVETVLRQPHRLSANDIGGVLRRFQVDGVPYASFEAFDYSDVSTAGQRILGDFSDELAGISEKYAAGQVDVTRDLQRAYRRAMGVVGDLEEEFAHEMAAASGAERLGPQAVIGTPNELYPHLFSYQVGDVARLGKLPEEGPHFLRSLRRILRDYGYVDEGQDVLGRRIERWAEFGQFPEGDLLKGEYWNARVRDAIDKGAELPFWARDITYTPAGREYAIQKITERLRGLPRIEGRWPSPGAIYEGFDDFVAEIRRVPDEAAAYAKKIADEMPVPEELRGMTDTELGGHVAELDFMKNGTQEWLDTFNAEARDALPDVEIARAYWNIREGEAIDDLSRAGRVTYGRKPSAREMEQLTGEELAKRMPKTGEAPKWDVYLRELEGRNPGFYGQLRARLGQQLGYAPGDEDVFREAVRMRNRIKKGYVDVWTAEIADYAEDLKVASTELIRRGMMEPQVSILRPGYLEQVRLDQPAVRELNDRLGSEVIEKVARGEIGPDELAKAVEDGVMSQEEVEAVMGLASGRGVNPTVAESIQSEVSQEADEIRRVIRAWMDDGRAKLRMGADIISQNAEQVKALRDLEKWGVQDWQTRVDDLVRSGVDRRHQILFDFAKRGNLDELASTAFPFHVWQTRNVPFALQTFSERPGLLATLLRYVNVSDEVREMAHLPESWEGYVPVPGQNIVSSLLGMEGQPVWVDPRNIIGLGVLSQFREPFELRDKELTPAEQIATAPQRMGLRTWPWMERAGRMAGVLPEAELPKGPITWLGRAGSALLGRPNIEEEVKDAVLERFGIDVTPKRNVIEDYYGNLRIVKMVQNEEIDYERAVQAINNLDDPLFQQAYEESMDDRSKLALLRSFEPFALRTMEEERMARRMAFNLGEPGIGGFMPTEPAEESTEGAVDRILEDPGPARHDSFLEALVMDTDTYGEYLDTYPLLTAEERQTLDQRWPDFSETMEDLMPYYSGQPGDLIRSRILRLAGAQGHDMDALLQEISQRDLAEGIEQRTLLQGWQYGATFPSDEARQEFWQTPLGQARLAESAIWKTPEEREQLIERGRGFRAYDIYYAKMDEVGDSLVAEGFVPGTRAWRTFNEWRWEERDRIQERYADLLGERREEPPVDVTPEEYGAWYREQEAREALDPYYEIQLTDFADEEGAIDWDAYNEEREAALDAIPEEVRLEAIAYLHRYYRPEEEAMTVAEDRVYRRIMDVIAEKRESEDEAERAALQKRIDDLKARADQQVDEALADAVSDIMALHPEWGEEEIEAMLSLDVPSFDTWTRSNDDPREAGEAVFLGFYWGLPDEARRITWDERWASQAGVSESYLGAEFEKLRKADPRQLSGLEKVSDEQLFRWIDQVGLVTILLEEGFPMPGVPLPSALRRIPGYERRVWGAEEPTEGAPMAAPGERVRGLVDPEAEVVLAVAGEEEDLTDAIFQLPTEEMQAEMRQAYAENAEWYRKRDAGEDPGPWTELMEKWMGDPDSPKSLYWARRQELCGVPEENNPLGWGLMPRALKDNPFTMIINEAYAEGTQDELSDDVLVEGLLAIEEFFAEHGEELMQAREEYRGYIATLNPGLEELQDKYYEFPERSQERRDFIKAHPELATYWEMKREYKNTHALMVEYYFPGTTVGTTYQRRGWGGGGGRRGGVPETDGWQQFTEAAGPQIIEALIDYWGGTRPLSDADRQYLVSLFKRYRFGAGNFEAWLTLLQQMWQASLGGGYGYEIPMRRHGIIVKQPERQQQWPDFPTAPRVRYLGRRG